MGAKLPKNLVSKIDLKLEWIKLRRKTFPPANYIDCHFSFSSDLASCIF